MTDADWMTDRLIEAIALRRALAEILASDDADEILDLIASKANESRACQLLFDLWVQRWN